MGQVTRAIGTINEKLKHLEEDVRELRKEVISLTVCIATLEESRKTLSAEVGARVTEVLSRWEVQQYKREAEQARNEVKRERPALPES